MNTRHIHRFCVGLMVLAMLTRLASQVELCLATRPPSAPTLWRVDIEAPMKNAASLSADPAASAPQKSSTGEDSAPPADVPTPENRSSGAPSSENDAAAPLEEALAASGAEAPAPLSFTPEEAEAITIAGQCSYTVDKQALLLQPSRLDFSGEAPKILIVHTHASEAYTPSDGLSYLASDTLRTEDASRSVIRLGSEIADILNEAGIETIHDTTLNDYPSYDGAYARMQTIIEGYLAQYPSIQMVIDVHRDAFENADGNPAALTIDIGGEECAKLMLVVGTDEGGLTHPDWQENLANALKLQALLNRAAPGLCRNLDLRTERFNQHKTPGSILCEFGASGNTLTQALSSARIFAQTLAEMAQGLGAENF